MRTALMIFILSLGIFGQELDDKTEFLGKANGMYYFVYPIEKKEDKVKFIGITSPVFIIEDGKMLVDKDNHSMIAFEGDCTTQEVKPIINISVRDGIAYSGKYNIPATKVGTGNMMSEALNKACTLNWDKLKKLLKDFPIGALAGSVYKAVN